MEFKDVQRKMDWLSENTDESVYLEILDVYNYFTNGTKKIARTVKLDAFVFNELAAEVYEIALDTLGVENIEIDE